MSKKHFVVDLDDVVFDLWGTLLPELNKAQGTYVKKEEMTNYHGCLSLFGLTLHEFLHFIVDKKILNRIPLKSLVHPSLTQLKQQGQIHLITARGFDPDAESLTRQALSYYDLPYDTLTITSVERKIDACPVDPCDVSATFDDYDGHVWPWVHELPDNHPHQSYLIKQPWNDHLDIQGHQRIHKVSHLYDGVQHWCRHFVNNQFKQKIG